MKNLVRPSISPLVFLLNFKVVLPSLQKSKTSVCSRYPPSDDADWLDRVILRFRPRPGPVRTLLNGPVDLKNEKRKDMVIKLCKVVCFRLQSRLASSVFMNHTEAKGELKNLVIYCDILLHCSVPSIVNNVASQQALHSYLN